MGRQKGKEGKRARRKGIGGKEGRISTIDSRERAKTGEQVANYILARLQGKLGPKKLVCQRGKNGGEGEQA